MVVLEHIQEDQSPCVNMQAAKNENNKVTQKEVYEATHRHKDGNYINEKAKIICEKYVAELSKKYVDTPQPEFDPDSWVVATGPINKNRVYGFGSRADPKIILGSSTTTLRVEPPAAPLDKEQLQSMIRSSDMMSWLSTTAEFKSIMKREIKKHIASLVRDPYSSNDLYHEDFIGDDHTDDEE